MSAEVILARSRIETMGRCKRKWYHSYVDGVTEPGTSRDLLIGIHAHTGMEVLLKTKGDIAAAMDAMPSPEGEDAEHIALARAMVLGWYRTQWPRWERDYNIISVEEEFLMPLAPGFHLLVRADAVVENKEDGYLYVINWKTTSRVDGFTRKWQYDIQMWTEAMGVEQQLGRPVIGCVVEGLYKGVWRDQHWASSLIWGSRKAIGEGRYKYSERRVPGWERFSVWDNVFPTAPEADPIAAWVGFLDLDTVDRYYVQTPPILRNDAVVEEWLEGVLRQEADARAVIEHGTADDHKTYFKQEFSEWNCGRCAFTPVCGKVTDVPSMVQAGLYVQRTSPVDTLEARLREGGVE